MTIFKNTPYLALLAIWAVIVVTSVTAVFLYHYDLSVDMGMGASAVVVALIGLPGVILNAVIKARGGK